MTLPAPSTVTLAGSLSYGSLAKVLDPDRRARRVELRDQEIAAPARSDGAGAEIDRVPQDAGERGAFTGVGDLDLAEALDLREEVARRGEPLQAEVRARDQLAGPRRGDAQEGVAALAGACSTRGSRRG